MITKYKIIIVFFAMILILTTIGTITYRNTIETVEIVVIEKERVISNDTSKYLIFTEDEVFENTDTILFLKFNSSDIYRKLEVGKSYSVTVVGYRIPVISLYRNIISIESNDIWN